MAKKKMSFDGYLCHLDGEPFPFCSQCWDSKQKVIHVHRVEKGHYVCPTCKTEVKTEDYVRPNKKSD